jgi:hypothetical protein
MPLGLADILRPGGVQQLLACASVAAIEDMLAAVAWPRVLPQAGPGLNPPGKPGNAWCSNSPHHRLFAFFPIKRRSAEKSRRIGLVSPPKFERPQCPSIRLA